jgi:uncharacterized membrane protein YeaQ/YmgE (transglycosylase-associated protein family)
MEIIYFLIIGAIAGWLAGLIMRGGGFGLLGNIVVGIIGAVIGGHLLGWLNIEIGLGRPWGALLTALIGAVVLLFIVGLIKRA